jgi:hypothetical protein
VQGQVVAIALLAFVWTRRLALDPDFLDKWIRTNESDPAKESEKNNNVESNSGAAPQ